MEEVYNKIDKDYLKAFNIGYAMSKDTGLKLENLDKLKPELLKKMRISKNRLTFIKDGMKQFAKDLEQNMVRKVNHEKGINRTINEPFKGGGLER